MPDNVQKEIGKATHVLSAFFLTIDAKNIKDGGRDTEVKLVGMVKDKRGIDDDSFVEINLKRLTKKEVMDKSFQANENFDNTEVLLDLVDEELKDTNSNHQERMG